jgi:O-antigen/teichoic acid export membrane protein/glycosyltransferase involved in cell wall biosynthesis
LQGLRSRLAGMSSEREPLALIRQAAALLSGQVAAAALTVPCTIVLARALGAEQFGQYALIAAFVLIVSQVLDARTWEAATQFASEHLAAGDTALARAAIEMAHLINVAGGLVAAILVFALATPISSELLGDAQLTEALVIYGAAAPFVALQSAAAIPFRVLGEFRRLAALTAISPLLRLAFVIVALAIGAELTGAVVALAAAEVVAAFVFVGLAQRLMSGPLSSQAFGQRIRAAFRELRRGWRVIVTSNVHGTLRLANEQLDVVIVGFVASPAAAGTLKIARTFAQPLVMIQKPFYEAIYPRLTAARAADRLTAEWEVIVRLTRLAAATLLPLAIAIAATSPWLVPSLAGAPFADAWLALAPIALTMAIVGTFFWLHPAALASGLQGRSVTSLALGTAVQAAAVIALVPSLGIAGAGIAYALVMAIWLALVGPAVRGRMGGEVPPARAPLVVVGPTTPPYHGGAMMTQRLLAGLRERGMVAAHLDTRDPRSLDSIGRFDARNIWLGIKHSFQFAALLARNPGARVYVPISQARWGFIRDAFFLLMARLARRPRIVHLNGGYFQTFYRDSGGAMRLIIRCALAGVEQAWVLTDRLREMFDGLVPPDRIKVVANSVEDWERREEPVADGGRGGEDGPGVVRVLFLSNLVPGKGWDELIAAAERLSEQARPMPLHIRLVGEVPTDIRERILRRSERLAKSGMRVEVLGTRVGEAKHQEYRWADLFVYPSTYCFEGQPLVLLEAMAAGLPIITSAMGGIPDTVVNGKSAVMIPPGDIDALVTSIQRATHDAALRRRIGAAARRRYLARYTPSRFDDTVEALIRSADGMPGTKAKPPRRDPRARPRPPNRLLRRGRRTSAP